ncbi:GNAT family N-acetyltransferase [Gallaecimonas sp. GXIMD4217]|uniref:GNAT family N-acetyltransferase n=1 Tax=Gallaecimonas sp. GXIMD4217 TaxID=3131927 RepID=UPI00311AEA77
MQWTRGKTLLSDDKAQLQLGVIHGFLTNSYWSPGIPRETVAKAIAGSYCFGLYRDGEQIGFGRLITDQATFAYLADVFVLEAYRGQGLAKWMLAEILAQEAFQGCRRILLATRDAHRLYAGLGFHRPRFPEALMELHRPGLYPPNCTHTTKEPA